MEARPHQDCSRRDHPFPPVPNISFSPTSAVTGSPDLTLTITGLHFAFSSVSHEFNQVVWSANGSDTSLATFVSSTQLTAVIPTALLTSGTQAKVRVEIWDILGDAPQATSSSVAFSMTKTPVGKLSVSFDFTCECDSRQLGSSVNRDWIKFSQTSVPIALSIFGVSVVSQDSMLHRGQYSLESRASAERFSQQARCIESLRGSR